MLVAVICPPIHSIVVVTSPMGDHAPPAFAATTIIPANNIRSSLSSIIFRMRETITMVEVKLSNTADKKKVIPHNNHNNLDLLRVLIAEVMIVNPSCASINSTMVMAANKKNRIPAALLK